MVESSPKVPRCPICNQPLRLGKSEPAFPFCSPRCKLVDLGNWLGGTYRIAGERLQENEEEES